MIGENPLEPFGGSLGPCRDHHSLAGSAQGIDMLANRFVDIGAGRRALRREIAPRAAVHGNYRLLSAGWGIERAKCDDRIVLQPAGPFLGVEIKPVGR